MEKIMKISKVFDVLAIIGMVVLGLCMAIMIVAIGNLSLVASYLPTVLQNSGVLNLTVEDPNIQTLLASGNFYTEVVSVLILSSVSLGLGFYQLVLARRGLKLMKAGMPFHPVVCTSLSKIMYVQIGICVLYVVSFLVVKFVFKSEDTSLEISGVLKALFLYFLVQIFRYGSTLKEPSDTQEIF